MECTIESTSGGFQVVCVHYCCCKAVVLKHTHQCAIKLIYCECGGCVKKQKRRIICRCNRERPSGPRNWIYDRRSTPFIDNFKIWLAKYLFSHTDFFKHRIYFDTWGTQFKNLPRDANFQAYFIVSLFNLIVLHSSIFWKEYAQKKLFILKLLSHLSGNLKLIEYLFSGLARFR